NGATGCVCSLYLRNGVGNQPSTDNSSSKSSYKATVNATSINVRSGDSTSYSVITNLPKGTVVDVIESASNGWKKVKTSNGTTGWVSGQYLTTGVLSQPSTPSTNKAQAVVDLAHK